MAKDAPSRVRQALSSAAEWTRRHPYLTLLGWVVWISGIYLVAGWWSYVRIHDNADASLAMHLALVDGKRVSFWASQWACGVDRFAQLVMNPMDAALSSVMPVWLYHGVLMLLQRLIAAWSTRALLVKRLRIGEGAAIFGAMTYSLFYQPAVNGSWAGWTAYDGLSLAALPLILLVLTAPAPLGRRLTQSVALGVAYGASGFLVFSPFCIVLVIAWVLFVTPKAERQGSIAGLVAFVLGCAAVVVPALVPAFSNTAASQRADWPLVTLSQGFKNEAWMLVGLIRDNLATVALLVAGAVSLRARALLRVGALTGLAASAVLLSPAVTWLVLRLGLPAGIQFNRFYLVLPFLIIMGGAMGVDGLIVAAAPAKRYGRSAVLTAVILLTVLISVGVNLRAGLQMMRGSNSQVIFRDPTMRALVVRERVAPGRMVTVPVADRGGLVVQPGYAWAYGLPTADGYLTLYSERYASYWALVMEPTFAGDKAVADYFLDWGNRIYLFMGGGFPETETVDIQQRYRLPLLSLANVRYFVSPVPLKGSGLTRLPGGSRGDESRLEVYENSEFGSHAFVPRRAGLISAKGVAQALRTRSARGLREEALFMRSDVAPDAIPAGDWEGEILSERATVDGIELRVRMIGDGLVVVAENYSPFWEATVDGAPTRVLPVYLTFQALRVPAGEHVVRLSYSPPYARPLSLSSTAFDGR